MAGAVVRARRVNEPTLTQRQNFQLEGDKPLEGLASAWDDMTQAKAALYRAEARLQQSEGSHLNWDHCSGSAGSHLEERHPSGSRIPVDSVPSVEIRPNSSPKASVDAKIRGFQAEKAKKRVTIKEDMLRTNTLPRLTPSMIPSQRHGSSNMSDFTEEASLGKDAVDKSVNAYRGVFSDIGGETSSKDILGNGPAHFSIGSSSEIRVLNDISAPSPLVHQSSTVEVSPGLRVSKDYIPAYDRLFGDIPVSKLGQNDSLGLAETMENRKLMRIISSNQKPRDQSTLNHMERLRHRVQMQKMASSYSLESVDNLRKRHQDSDPVQVNSEVDTDLVLGLHAAPKVPVRKVASAPAAPAYKGFSQVEARFQMPGGRIVTEDQLKRKTSRQNVKNGEHVPPGNPPKTGSTKPLQPSQRQMADNKINSKSHSIKGHQKPVRKVHKAPRPSAKPRKLESALGISASAWREGQRTVMKVLGPPLKAPIQTADSPPTNDNPSEGKEGQAPIHLSSSGSEDEVDRLSEHPIESDNERSAHGHSESSPPGLSTLPHEAQGVLNDLHLDDTDDEREMSSPPPESKSSKNNNNVPRLSRKKKMSRLKSKEGEPNEASVRKERHYEVDEVQKYMAKQRVDRKKKIQEEKKQRALLAEKKKEQLRDLYKRQRDSAKTSQKGVGMDGKPVGTGKRFLDETFSKGPGLGPQPNIARPVSLHRHHLYQDNHRRVDMTGSDKENRAFWSTSSSDSSLRSSPQTDLSASTPQDPQPAPGGFAFPEHHHEVMGVGRDIVLEPVREEELPPPSVVIKNQLNSGDSKPSKNDIAAGVASAPSATSQKQIVTARPRPIGAVSKPRSKAERVAALKATAAALQGRLENEVRQLTGDLTSLTAGVMGSSHISSGTTALRSPSNERWAYPLPTAGKVPGSNPAQLVRHGVRFTVPDSALLDQESPKLTKHQRVAGTNKDYNVFVGPLPGVSNLSQQAKQTEESRTKGEAATTIQAAFRGHQVRQKLTSELPSGSTLKQQIMGKKEDAPIPQIRLSPSKSHSKQDRVLLSDGGSLSEGPLSDESSEAEVDQEYTPKFKSLPIRAQKKMSHPHENKQTNLNFVHGQPLSSPKRDGLSVIDVYMRRYQEAQRELLTRQRPSPSPHLDKSFGPPHSHCKDLTGRSLSSLNDASHLLDSPYYSRAGEGPIPSSVSADNISDLLSGRIKPSLSHKASPSSKPPTGRSLSLPSPGKDHTLTDTFNSLSVSEKKRSRTPSPRPTSLRDAGTQTPPSSRNSPASIKSRSSSSRGSHSPPSDTRSPVSDHKSPVDEIRSLIEDLKKSASITELSHGEGARSEISPLPTSPLDSDSRHSPPSGTSADSPASPQPCLGPMGSLGGGAKSPITREVLNHFKPISHPGKEMLGRLTNRSTSSTSSSILSSATAHPGPKFFSPSALQLKMAAELNLLETLEESVRQLSEVERSRAVAVAQQESTSLARILQARQRDHEKELQLLSLKAKQEVEAANRQLEEVRERAAVTALEAEQVLVQARRDAAAETRDSAQKLLLTQADAARVTAEAAKQLAEAHKVSVSRPPPLPPAQPQLDAGQVAADTAKAAASAAVTAALEHQRLHERDRLREMQSSLHPPPPVTRSIATGDSRVNSATPSQNSENKSPSAHYTEDFTNTASLSSHSLTSKSSSDSVSSQKAVTSSEGSLSRHSDASKGVKAASSIPVELGSAGQDHSESIAMASDIVVDEDLSKFTTSSSIRTEGGAKGSSTAIKTVSGNVDDTKSNLELYSTSFDNSESEQSSISSVVSPTPKTSEGAKEPRSTPRRATGKDTSTSRDKNDSTDSAQSEKMPSVGATTVEMIQKQLKDEEARSQQQVTLLRLREKVLVDKTNAELEWLEHQKRRLKEKDDQGGIASLRKRQRALLAKLQAEQAEIKRLLSSQKQSSLERQRLLYQQQEIVRLRKAAVRYKNQMKDLPISPASTLSVCAGSEDDTVDGFRLASPDSASGSSQISGSPPGGVQEACLQDPQSMEKQAKVMQKLKMLQQPLSMKLLMRREMKLKKRRKNVEELLAWKQRLDQEEKHVADMEHEVLHLWDTNRHLRKVKATERHGKDRNRAEALPRDGNGYSSASPPLPLQGDTKSEGETSEEFSYKSDSLNGNIKSDGSVSRTKSEPHRVNSKSALSERKPPASSSDGSICEEVQNSSIAEEIASEKSASGKSVSESPQTGGDLSSDDTIKEASAFQEYTSGSFESGDRTITPSKADPSSRGAIQTSPSPPAQSRGLTSSTPKSLGRGAPCRSGPFTPPQRTRHPSDSGSESEKSFSQTMSETASDQSDVEGRVRALKDALKRRKMEADRLRKQQKRLNREKLKAQEASLKKQLETYDSFIEKTKSELEQESKKQKLQGPLFPTPSTKPQIKQPKGVTDSLRQARVLRKRTASDSSQEGLSEGRSVASVKAKSGSESGGRSSRSSLEGVLGEERVGGAQNSRDVSYSSVSTASSPSTQQSEGAVSPKSPLNISRDRSMSASSSIAEDISIRSEYSDRESVHDSEKFDSEDHRKLKEKLHKVEQIEDKGNEVNAVSISPISGGRLSGDGRDAEEYRTNVNMGGSQVLLDKHTSSALPDDSSISSSVPEEVISAASIKTQDSFEEAAKAAVIVTSSPKLDHELPFNEGIGEVLHSPRSPQAMSSPSGDRASLNSIPDDVSLRSVKSVTSSVHSRSSSHLSSRSQSLKSEGSYSEDFAESSTSQNHDSKSDTDEDISEHLSDASEVSVARSSHSQHSGQAVFELKDKISSSETVGDLSGARHLPEATVTPRKPEGNEGTMNETFNVTPDAAVESKPVEILPGFEIGDRVLIGGKQPGMLRFKGPTHFASGTWAGVELEEPIGTNDGTIETVSYFSCNPKYGIFAPADKLSHRPKNYIPKEDTVVSDDEASEQSSIQEDIPSESSVKTVSESDLIKSRGVGKDIVYEPKSNEHNVEEDKDSDVSLSQLISIKSEDNRGGEDTDDEVSVGGIDDDALEKVISNAAEAVESFSHDEPGVWKPELVMDTPRGAPDDESPDIEDLPHESEGKQNAEDSSKQIVNEMERNDVNMKIIEKQELEESERKLELKDSLLGILVTTESPRSDNKQADVPVKKASVEITEKEDVEHRADYVAKSLMNEAISEILNLRRQRNAKIEQDNVTLRNKEKEKDNVQEIKTPEDSVSPELRAETPYTPDKSPERRIDLLTPLDDDIFINRVHIESAFGNDNVPVARPGSPVFGESGSVSPEALNEKLEQLQLLDKDILEADLFGDQEWFDDEFGSMPKSKSIIKVPSRVSAEKKQETPAGIAAQEAKVAAKQRNAHIDLRKIVEEPFYAVPHNVKDVKDLASASVKVFHAKVLKQEPFIGLTPPMDILGSETKGADIESTSRRAYKHLLFTLSGEVYQAICQEQEPTVQPPWMKPKRKPRRYFFHQPPRNQADLTMAVEDRVLCLTGLVTKPRQETALSGSKLSKKKDHVDEILIDELKAEEPEWIDYDKDELSVKMQLADALFESLLVDTAMALHQIEDKRKARGSHHQEDHFSHHDVEF